jgi:hypothetical protein
MHFNLRIKVAFNGGDLTSDSCLLLVKEFNEKVGLHELIRSVQIKDPVNHTEHTNDAVIMQKIY